MQCVGIDGQKAVGRGVIARRREVAVVLPLEIQFGRVSANARTADGTAAIADYTGEAQASGIPLDRSRDITGAEDGVDGLEDGGYPIVLSLQQRSSSYGPACRSACRAVRLPRQR